MKKLIKVNNGITVKDLVDICDKYGISMNTEISIMGAETRYIIIDSTIMLDERNCLDEIDEEYEDITEVSDEKLEKHCTQE